MKKFIKTTILGLAMFSMTGCGFFNGGEKDKTLSRSSFIEEGLKMMSSCTEAQLSVSTLTIKTSKLVQGGNKEEYDLTATIKDGEWETEGLTSEQHNECIAQCAFWESKTVYKICKLMDGSLGSGYFPDYTFVKLAAGGYTATGKSEEFAFNSNGLLTSYKSINSASTLTRTYVF